MIRQTFHQIWNQRRQNLWIWLELAVLSAFLWIVLRPLFTMVCIKNVSNGFDRNRIYYIKPSFAFMGYDAGSVLDDANFVPTLDNLLTQLQNHPMVEAVSIANIAQMPGGTSSFQQMFYRSANEADEHRGDNNYATHAQTFSVPVIAGLEKWTDVLYTLGVRDAFSGEYIHTRPDALAQRLVYMSSDLANLLYGTTDVRDSMVYSLDREDPFLVNGEAGIGRLRKVDGVYAPVKEYDFELPFPSVFKVESSDAQLHYFGVLVRLKEGADGDTFMKNVHHDVLQNYCTPPFRKFEVTSLAQQMDMAAEYAGANNMVRVYLVLGFFGLLCVFLGVSGLFWVRCGERRQDIGVMRSLGASRREVKRQMLWEGTLLLTAAFLTAMVFVAWYVHANGYDEAAGDGQWKVQFMNYWFYRPMTQIVAVTLLTYVLMLLITLLATWVPVHRATRILPSDALRDE